MAVISRKISSFPQLSKLTGEELLVVASKGKTYKIPVSMLSGNAITEIAQRVNLGDGAESKITITIGDGESSTRKEFSIFNGQQGSKGPDGDIGPKGPKGDTAVAIYDESELSDLIYDSLSEDTERELSSLILSAKQGKVLNDKLEKLKEEFLTQAEYDDKLNRGLIDSDVKYFIWE